MVRPYTVLTAVMSVMLCAGARADMGSMAGMPMSQAKPVYGAHAWVSWARARTIWRQSLTEGRRQGRRIVFHGPHDVIDVVAVAPGHPDMSFEVGGLTNPTLVVPEGDHVTLRLLNMDYGPGMAHGITVTATSPPYAPMVAGQLHGIAGVIALIPPRTAKRLMSSRYAVSAITVETSRPGLYYYVCQAPGHANGFRMYGQFIVRRR